MGEFEAGRASLARWLAPSLFPSKPPPSPGFINEAKIGDPTRPHQYQVDNPTGLP